MLERWRCYRAALAVAFLLLAACARQVLLPATPAPDLPADFPLSHYEQAAAAGATVFRLDPAHSLAVITVRRGGALARLGHDHVVASHDLAGFVALDQLQGDLYLPVARLRVDEVELRKEAALDTQPSAGDIAGTHQNMLDKVLEVTSYPWIRLHVRAADLKQDGVRLTVALTLHGVTRELQVPASVTVTDSELKVSGQFELEQSAFGIAPFSVLGGALQVLDRVALRFQISARRI